ncbi:MAG: M1 family metallopeptidase [Deltaproteobacteria bacterium]|nr:M1 family metallopeptidase [Deltaproteobacteria bacterium]
MPDWGRGARVAALVICCGIGAGARGAPIEPDRRGAVAPDRSFDLLKLELDLELLPAERAVVGRATYHLARLSPGPLLLDQVDLQIAEVRVGGDPAPWHMRGERLVIDLPASSPGQRPPPVEVRWRARPRTGMHFRAPGPHSPDRHAEVWTQGEPQDHRHWFPNVDHPGDRFAYEGKVKAPDGWIAHTNSGPDLVNYLVMVAAGTYEEVVHPADPRLKLWVPPRTDPEAVARVLQPLPAMKAFFEVRTGEPWPWGDYLQVYAQRFPYGGMENTGATINDAGQLVDDRVGHRQRTERVVAHELAHQWFGDLLTCRTFRELWLNEGFASFMEAEWEGHAHGPHAYAARVDAWQRSAAAGPALAGRFFHAEGEPDSGSVYGKGPQVLHMLRQLLGEELWWEGVRRYVADQRHQLVETSDLRVALEEVSGRDLGWFFQQWVDLAAVPALTVRDQYESGLLIVDVRQQVDEQRPRFTLPVVVAVGLAEGGEARVEGWLEDERLQLRLPLASPPAYVAFDPDGGLLATVDQVQDPASWGRQALAASPLARRRALVALGQTDAVHVPAAILALAPADEEERHRLVPLRVAAAEALGEQRALTPLLGAAADRSARVRIAVAGGLGKIDRPEARAELDRMVRQDANPDVRAAALRGLGERDPAAALAHARRLTRLRDTEEQELRAAAVALIGAHGSAADLPLLLDPGAPERGRVDGLHAAVALSRRLAPAEREVAAAAAARFGASMLQDDDLRTRQGVGRALGALGHRAALPALEAWRRWEREPEARAIAAGAVAAVQAGAPPSPTPPPGWLGELKLLEERVNALEAELDALRGTPTAPVVAPPAP